MSTSTRRPRRRGRWIVAGVAVALLGVAASLGSRWALTDPGLAGFFDRYDGTSLPPSWAPVGLPAWVGILHWLNTLLLGFIVISGLRVRSKVRPPAQTDRKSVV